MKAIRKALSIRNKRDNNESPLKKLTSKSASDDVVIRCCNLNIEVTDVSRIVINRKTGIDSGATSSNDIYSKVNNVSGNTPLESPRYEECDAYENIPCHKYVTIHSSRAPTDCHDSKDGNHDDNKDIDTDCGLGSSLESRKVSFSDHVFAAETTRKRHASEDVVAGQCASYTSRHDALPPLPVGGNLASEVVYSYLDKPKTSAAIYVNQCLDKERRANNAKTLPYRSNG